MKLSSYFRSCRLRLSPPAWWCGLKFWSANDNPTLTHVTTCVVVWIEIPTTQVGRSSAIVTTCVVVWIEIYVPPIKIRPRILSPPAWWCGLKFLCEPFCYMVVPSPPAWWCGLKSMCMALMSIVCKSPPAWWCGLKLLCCPVGLPARCHHLRGGVD